MGPHFQPHFGEPLDEDEALDVQIDEGDVAQAAEDFARNVRPEFVALILEAKKVAEISARGGRRNAAQS